MIRITDAEQSKSAHCWDDLNQCQKYDFHYSQLEKNEVVPGSNVGTIGIVYFGHLSYLQIQVESDASPLMYIAPW